MSSQVFREPDVDGEKDDRRFDVGLEERHFEVVSRDDEDVEWENYADSRLRSRSGDNIGNTFCRKTRIPSREIFMNQNNENWGQDAFYFVPSNAGFEVSARGLI